MTSHRAPGWGTRTIALPEQSEKRFWQSRRAGLRPSERFVAEWMPAAGHVVDLSRYDEQAAAMNSASARAAKLHVDGRCGG
jgi:hypothetical protein